MAATNERQLTPQERAALFMQATRQYYQQLPAYTAGAGETISFDIPKSRLLAKVRLMVEATVKVTHASATSYVASPYAPYTLLRRTELSVNNGFNPFIMNGKQAFLYSLMRDNSSVLYPQTSGRGRNVLGLAASSSGASNKVRFVLDLPLTINDKEPVGLILTQNQETVVTVNLDIADPSAIGSGQAGYTFEYVGDVKVTPFVESFSVPQAPQAVPDLSAMKLVQGSTQAITGAGEQTFKFPTGMIYRKIAFLVEDTNGVGFADTDITSNIEISFNQADFPYRVSPLQLAAINEEFYGKPLPAGAYAFDLTYQGMANYGGTRDYINTERLTEFWLKFNTSKAGQITVVYENLTRLTPQ